MYISDSEKLKFIGETFSVSLTASSTSFQTLAKFSILSCTAVSLFFLTIEPLRFLANAQIPSFNRISVLQNTDSVNNLNSLDSIKKDEDFKRSISIDLSTTSPNILEIDIIQKGERFKRSTSYDWVVDSPEPESTYRTETSGSSGELTKFNGSTRQNL